MFMLISFSGSCDTYLPNPNPKPVGTPIANKHYGHAEDDSHPAHNYRWISAFRAVSTSGSVAPIKRMFVENESSLPELPT
jgi:hypothetical protein